MSAQPNGESLSVNDGQLLSQFSATGDQQAFSHLVARHGPMVLRICRRICGGDPHGAEDAAQDVFLMLASRASALKTRMSLAGWLYRTAWHVATRQRRNVAVRADHEALAGIERAVTAAAGEESKEPIPFALVSSELSDALGRALGNLPENYRNALVLHHVAGYTVEETAVMLGVKVGTAAAWMSRGRVLMRDRLGTLLVGGISCEAVVGWLFENAPPGGFSWGDAGNLTAWSGSGSGRHAIALAAEGKTSAAGAAIAAPAYACGKAAGILGMAAAAAGAVPGGTAAGAVISSGHWAASGPAAAASTGSAASTVGATAVAAVSGAKVAGLGVTAIGLTLVGGTLVSGGSPEDASPGSRSDSSHSSPRTYSSGPSGIVPEPSFLLPLFLMGAFVLLTFRRRRRLRAA
jgi:RNA polymerase sigma factor (sigma-70 family)